MAWNTVADFIYSPLVRTPPLCRYCKYHHKDCCRDECTTFGFSSRHSTSKRSYTDAVHYSTVNSHTTVCYTHTTLYAHTMRSVVYYMICNYNIILLFHIIVSSYKIIFTFSVYIVIHVMVSSLRAPFFRSVPVAQLMKSTETSPRGPTKSYYAADTVAVHKVTARRQTYKIIK